jgi:hypothetical protein
MIGLWFVAMINVCVGLNVQKSSRIRRAVIGSLPVSSLTIVSFSRFPASVSIATTSRFPNRSARSVGCVSVFFAMSMSGGHFMP